MNEELVKMVNELPDGKKKKEMLSILNEEKEVAKSNDKVEKKVKEPKEQEKDKPVSKTKKGLQEEPDGKLPKTKDEKTIPKGDSKVLKQLETLQKQWNDKFDELSKENKAYAEASDKQKSKIEALENQKQRGFEPKNNPDLNDENQEIADKAASFTRNKW